MIGYISLSDAIYQAMHWGRVLEAEKVVFDRIFGAQLYLHFP